MLSAIYKNQSVAEMAAIWEKTRNANANKVVNLWFRGGVTTLHNLKEYHWQGSLPVISLNVEDDDFQVIIFESPTVTVGLNMAYLNEIESEEWEWEITTNGKQPSVARYEIPADKLWPAWARKMRKEAGIPLRKKEEPAQPAPAAPAAPAQPAAVEKTGNYKVALKRLAAEADAALKGAEAAYQTAKAAWKAADEAASTLAEQDDVSADDLKAAMRAKKAAQAAAEAARVAMEQARAAADPAALMAAAKAEAEKAAAKAAQEQEKAALVAAVELLRKHGYTVELPGSPEPAPLPAPVPAPVEYREPLIVSAGELAERFATLRGAALLPTPPTPAPAEEPVVDLPLPPVKPRPGKVAA